MRSCWPVCARCAATIAAMMPPEQAPVSTVCSLPVIRAAASMASRMACAVGVEIPFRVPGVRVAPGDHEHLQAAADQVLHHAPPGRQVHHVELVDHRRDDHQRDLPDRGGGRAVLDQLEHRGPQDHRPGRDGQVHAHLERVRLDHGRHPGRDRHVGGEMPQALQGAAAAGVDGGLHRRRVQQRVIARGQRVDQVGQHEADAFGVGLVQAGLGHHALRGLRTAAR